MSTQQVIDNTVEAVREDLLSRSRLGIAKYGTTLDRTDLNLREWLQHAYEETLDQANYLKRAILDMEAREAAAEYGVALPELADRIVGELIPHARGASMENPRNTVLDLLILARAEAPARFTFGGPEIPEPAGEAEPCPRTRRPLWRRLFPTGE